MCNSGKKWLNVFATVFLSKGILFSISNLMFDDHFAVLETRTFLKATPPPNYEIICSLHSSILSLKYVRLADFIKRCNLFLKNRKVLLILTSLTAIPVVRLRNNVSML